MRKEKSLHFDNVSRENDFSSFFAQTDSGRMHVSCSQCKNKFYPTPLTGISRYAGSPYCSNCGTDFRNWVAFQLLID